MNFSFSARHNCSCDRSFTAFDILNLFEKNRLALTLVQPCGTVGVVEVAVPALRPTLAATAGEKQAGSVASVRQT